MEASFFSKAPELYPVYLSLAGRLGETYGDLSVQVKKTQISFYNKHLFACVSFPRRLRKGQNPCFILTFGLPARVESPAIYQAVEPYPNRWTHHVLIEKQEDLTPEVYQWLDAAYWFARNK